MNLTAARIAAMTGGARVTGGRMIVAWAAASGDAGAGFWVGYTNGAVTAVAAVGKEAVMGLRREPAGHRHGIQQLFRLVWVGLVVAAVVKELRTPSTERTWHGVVAGFVPYDLRIPTVARLRERVWAPEDEHLLTPHPFGVGWTLNAGRAVSLVRQRFSAG